MDEVHVQQHLFVEAQDAQGSAEEGLFAVPAKDVPHATRQVQWEGLAVQGEDPEAADELEWRWWGCREWRERDEVKERGKGNMLGFVDMQNVHLGSTKLMPAMDGMAEHGTE